jgi:hypothetical protein
MLVARAHAESGDITIIGLDKENLDRLTAGRQAESKVDGLPHVVIFYGETLRDIMADLVVVGWLPQEALDNYEPPIPDAVRTWTPEDGMGVHAVDPRHAPSVAPIPDLPGGDEIMGSPPVSDDDLDEATLLYVRLTRAGRHSLEATDQGEAAEALRELEPLVEDSENLLTARGVTL